MSAVAPVREVALSPRDQPEPSNLVLMFERLATNKDVDVEKLQRLIEMQERVIAHNAKAAFDAAFVRMRPCIPTILERARTDKTSYAPLEDIIETVTPILSEHGFSLSFRTEWPSEKLIKVVGILTHEAGHARESEFQSGADKTGSKNDIQALASAVSYGKRYTTNDLLCIVTRGVDDDGGAAGRSARPAPQTPAGFDRWLDDLTAVADEGIRKLEQTWRESRADYRNHLTNTNRARLESLKTKARAKDREAGR